MPQPHKHAAVIKAWADGAQIQTKSLNGWKDLDAPGWAFANEYRVKPPTVSYRNYLYRLSYGSYVVRCIDRDGNSTLGPEEQPGFVKWINDWQEIEVTE